MKKYEYIISYIYSSWSAGTQVHTYGHDFLELGHPISKNDIEEFQAKKSKYFDTGRQDSVTILFVRTLATAETYSSDSGGLTIW